ncbi:hypothetical protein FACS1894166_08810 [Bacilli bacterium]|nr:hypothetical protein FACS1894166_08810 [Bacilli bacterium]
MNSYEREHVDHYLRIVFAQTRNLKNLIIDFPVNKKERVYYRYENVDLYRMDGTKLIRVVTDGEFYITTQKILLAKQLDIFPIELSAIKEIKMSKSGLMIVTNLSAFIFKTYDSYTLYVSLERVIRLMKKA